jgi:hypothetical protein
VLVGQVGRDNDGLRDYVLIIVIESKNRDIKKGIYGCKILSI